MKILVVIGLMRRGGAERVVSRLSAQWSKAHEVRVAVFDSSEMAYSHGGRLIDLNVPIRVKPKRVWNMRLPSARKSVVTKAIKFIRRVVKLARLIRRERPRRIISFLEYSNFPVIVAAMLTGTLPRTIVSVRDNPASFPLGDRLLMAALYRFPRRVVVVARGMADALHGMAWHGAPKKNLLFIPNPAPRVGPSHESANDATRRPSRYILGVGTIVPKKGFDRLIAAFAAVDDPRLRLAILGEHRGKEYKKLAAQADSLGVAERVTMPGGVDNIGPWYRGALCFVLSSRYEGWPNVVIEAMAHGCPVVSFDCDYGPAEIIEPGVSGILVPDGDIDALAEAISNLIADDAKRRSLSAAGMAAMKQYDIAKISGLWLAD